LVKSVKVHDDTHRELKRLKARRRFRSIDEVVRDMIRETTGVPVEKDKRHAADSDITIYTRE